MFGDFSRFENDPEVGLNGIYLSQGSPILDSDWNEQVAALTDWITAIGDFVASRVEGFAVNATDETKITIGPGKAMVDGRVAQSQRKLSGQVAGDQGKFRVVGNRIFSDDFSHLHDCNAYLSLVSRSLPVRQISKYKSFRNGSFAVAEVTDWSIYFSDQQATPQSRSVGDGRSLVPRLAVRHTYKFPESCQTALVECHYTDQVNHWFKVAYSPNNVVDLAVSGPKELKNGVRIPLVENACALLGLASDDEIYAEYEDDATAHMRSVKLLRPDGQPVMLNDVSQIFRVKLARNAGAVTLELLDFQGTFSVDPTLRPCLRLWNAQSRDLLGVAAGIQIWADAGQVLCSGDRWYIPVEGEVVDLPEDGTLAGHRPFRAIRKLDNVQGLKAVASSTSHEDDSRVVAIAPVELTREKVNHLHPVAHRLDDSLHRLTGALNAARSLTRQTPCKELQTRVSYLPLRRWLASAYVHEIADLDLDGFLAKVRRSIDVAPEDEHRFREQAGLILEEANQLAGSITPRPKSDTNRESDTMVSTPTDSSHPMTLGSATRDALQQAFTQEIPRA